MDLNGVVAIDVGIRNSKKPHYQLELSVLPQGGGYMGNRKLF